MNTHVSELQSLTEVAVRHAYAELSQRFGHQELSGFALCTDDELKTLYHVACTRSWVRARKSDYPGIEFIYAEWSESARDELFEQASERLANLAGKFYLTRSKRIEARNQRFEALVRALKVCRDSDVFPTDAFLCVGSTDPSDDLEVLAMRGVELLNSLQLADQFAEHLGYEKYRSKK